MKEEKRGEEKRRGMAWWSDHGRGGGGRTSEGFISNSVCSCLKMGCLGFRGGTSADGEIGLLLF